MKYIVENPDTLHALRMSMGGCEPIIASYFFWINGTELQRSQNGLLRSLLYELLRNNQELIETAWPDLWRSMTTMIWEGKDHERTWRRVDLLSAFERLAKSGSSATRLCVFIDGLDEYDGDPDELQNTIHHLRTIGIKMCVASRPWNVFEAAFGHDPDHKIYLQDVNKPDIEFYVNEILRSLPEFQRLQIHTAEADEIVEEVVEKSQGVFLWVFLVVRSLRAGLRNHDPLSLLRKRLAEMPSDLKEFFDHMFKSIEATYRVRTAHVFQVALHVNEPLAALVYWFLDELEDNPDMALTMPVNPLTTSAHDDLIDQTRFRINGRYKGLLEITTLKERSTVDFLHRTVKDFLMTTETRRIFIGWQHQDFDPDLAISRACLAELKSFRIPDTIGSPPVSICIHNILRAAKELEKQGKQICDPYLDELQLVDKRYRELARQFYQRPSRDSLWCRLAGNDFVDVAIRYDLQLYLRSTLPALAPSLSANSKLDYLCRAWRSRISHPIIAESSELQSIRALVPVSLDMACIVVSFGSTMELDSFAQVELASSVDGEDGDTILKCFKEMSNHVSFAIDEEGHFQMNLHNALQQKLTADELQSLIQLQRLGPRKNRRGAKTDKPSWFKRHFR